MDASLLLVIVIGVLIFGILIWAFTFKTKAEKEYEQQLNDSLEDEYIIDPETREKLTLQQAESGEWAGNRNKFQAVSEREIQKLYTEEQKEEERAFNYFKRKSQYRRQNLNPEQIDFLSQTAILSKHPDWTYSDAFHIESCKALVFSPSIKIVGGDSEYQEIYHESQCLFWIKLDLDLGHYFFKEKSTVDKFLGLVKNETDLQLDQYASCTFEETENTVLLRKLLAQFEGHEKFEIEFMANNLLVKTIRRINLHDIKRLELILKKICQPRSTDKTS